MKNERLDPVFLPVNGRRLCIVSGCALKDFFFLDDVNGAHTIVEALGRLATHKGFELTVCLDMQGTTRFPTKQMDLLFAELTAATTPPRSGEAAKAPFQPRERSSGPMKTAPSDLEQHVISPVRNQLGRLKTALDSGRRILAIIEHPEELWVDNPTKSDVDILKVLAEAATASKAHPDSILLLLVNPDRQEDLLTWLDQVTHTEPNRRSIDLVAPNANEVRLFLERVMLREGLYGAKLQVVNEAVARRWLLFHLHEALRRVLLLPVENRLVERALDTGIQHESPEAVFEKLDRMVGLEPIKRQLRRYLAIAQQQVNELRDGRPVQPLNTHMLFLGNPGTGKTEVARLVGKSLRAIGLRSSGEIVEVSRTDIASQYNSGECIRRMQDAVDRAAGGVLFIDEAYQLAEGDWMRGALESLMKAMEDHRDSFTVILAGYEERMQDLWNVNPGFRSRIPESNWFRFPDYRIDELIEIFRRMCESRDFGLEADAISKASSYLESEVRRGRFGNARGVRNLVDEIVQRCMEHGERVVKAASVPDPERYDEERVGKLLGELRRQYLGLDSLHSFLWQTARSARTAEGRGVAFDDNLHCRFVGPPGTGKTSAARKLGEILRAMGLLSRGHLHEVNPIGDFGSSYVGEYARRVAEQFQKARGGVLFVDEAHQLCEQEQGRQILHQIVQTLTGPGFADTVLVLAGYREPMNALTAANPGLQSRIPNEIVFEHLQDSELTELFHRDLEEREFIIYREEREEFERRLKYRLSELRSDPGFASARTLKTLVHEVLNRQAARVESTGTRQKLRILPEDIGDMPTGDSFESLLDDFEKRFTGMNDLKAVLRRLAITGRMQRQRGGEAPPAPRLVFLGNPGTGKTTAARKLGQMLRTLGCTRNDRFVEVRGVELKAAYLGQTKDKVLKAFHDANGGLLFIDEAYSLQATNQAGGDSFAVEAIDTLVGQSELQENLRTAIILAGYTDPMKGFLQTNPGLVRRFPDKISFPDYSVEESLEILRNWFLVKEPGYPSPVTPEVLPKVAEAITRAKNQPHFGNAGAMETLGRRILEARDCRVYQQGGRQTDLQVSANDVECGLRVWSEGQIP